MIEHASSHGGEQDVEPVRARLREIEARDAHQHREVRERRIHERLVDGEFLAQGARTIDRDLVLATVRHDPVAVVEARAALRDRAAPVLHTLVLTWGSAVQASFAPSLAQPPQLVGACRFSSQPVASTWSQSPHSTAQVATSHVKLDALHVDVAVCASVTLQLTTQPPQRVGRFTAASQPVA